MCVNGTKKIFHVRDGQNHIGTHNIHCKRTMCVLLLLVSVSKDPERATADGKLQDIRPPRPKIPFTAKRMGSNFRVLRVVSNIISNMKDGLKSHLEVPTPNEKAPIGRGHKRFCVSRGFFCDSGTWNATVTTLTLKPDSRRKTGARVIIIDSKGTLTNPYHSHYVEDGKPTFTTATPMAWEGEQDGDDVEVNRRPVSRVSREPSRVTPIRSDPIYPQPSIG